MSGPPPYNPDPHAHPGLHAIALFEAFKGVLALASASGLALLGPQPIRHWVFELTWRLHLHPERGLIAHFLDAISTHTVHLTALILLGYATLRFVEAWGLWRVRAWASWLGVIGAAAYLPFEIYALWQHPDWMTWGVFLLNLMIVLVLARDLRRRRGAV